MSGSDFELAAEWKARAEELRVFAGTQTDECARLRAENARLRAELDKAECSTCHGKGKVVGDCGDSPNLWFDPCPDCQPATLSNELARRGLK